MPIVITEQLIGVIDGVNTLFQTSASYLPGTTRVFLNGVMDNPSDDSGHIELGGQSIQLKQAPVTGDNVAVRYTTVI